MRRIDTREPSTGSRVRPPGIHAIWLAKEDGQFLVKLMTNLFCCMKHNPGWLLYINVTLSSNLPSRLELLLRNRLKPQPGIQPGYRELGETTALVPSTGVEREYSLNTGGWPAYSLSAGAGRQYYLSTGGWVGTQPPEYRGLEGIQPENRRLGGKTT